jgi:hypothetical protein
MNSRYDLVSENMAVMKMIKIDRRQTDKFIIFDTGNRLDMVSNDYYGNPNYYWIILMANPKYSMPDQIQNGDQIRIPLPLSDVFEEIEEKSK